MTEASRKGDAYEERACLSPGHEVKRTDESRVLLIGDISIGFNM